MNRRLASTAINVNRQIPFPSLRDLVRNGFPLKNYESRIIDFMHSSKDIYGDIYKVKIPLGPEAVMIFNPNDAEIVYRAAGKWPNRPGFHALEQFRSTRPLYSNAAGLLSSQGEPWYDFRSKVQTALLRPRHMKAYHDRVDRVAQDFINGVFKETLDDGHATPDLIEHLYQWGLESTGILAFDRRLGVLNPSLSSGSESQEIIDLVQKIFSLTQELERNFIWKYIGVLLPNYRKMIKCLDKIEKIAKKYTDEKIDEIESGKESGSSVIENLYKTGCDRNVLCVLALDMLMAGVDTAANQISFAFHYIAQNPGVQEKLLREIQSLDLEDPSFVDNAAYLRATLKEVLRMRPTAYVNSRICDMPVEVNNYRIEKGNMVLFWHIIMCHDSRFVDSPAEFRPERYIKDHPQYERLQPFTSLPFGYGPRVCVGRRFANMEMYLLIARILQKYTLQPTSASLKINIPLLMKPEGAIPVRFVPRT